MLLITHNPLIASKADRHFLVSKKVDAGIDRLEKEAIDSNTRGDLTVKGYSMHSKGGGGGGVRSTLTEVTGEAREIEISRMATGGGVHSVAGLALAKALLGTAETPRECAV